MEKYFWAMTSVKLPITAVALKQQSKRRQNIAGNHQHKLTWWLYQTKISYLWSYWINFVIKIKVSFRQRWQSSSRNEKKKNIWMISFFFTNCDAVFAWVMHVWYVHWHPTDHFGWTSGREAIIASDTRIKFCQLW